MRQYLRRSGWGILLLVCLVTSQDLPPASQPKGDVAALETKSLLAQARTTLHRFAEALADLAEAERLGVNSDRCAAVRATIFQASGRYDEALAIRQHLSQARPDIRSLGAEAAVRAERGEIDEAERLFVKAQQQYRDVSPFPVVWLYFQQGLMWMWEGNLERARVAFEAACTRLPGYAAGQGHLALVEAALGRHGRARTLLRRWMQDGDA